MIHAAILNLSDCNVINDRPNHHFILSQLKCHDECVKCVCTVYSLRDRLGNV